MLTHTSRCKSVVQLQCKLQQFLLIDTFTKGIHSTCSNHPGLELLADVLACYEAQELELGTLGQQFYLEHCLDIRFTSIIASSIHLTVPLVDEGSRMSSLCTVRRLCDGGAPLCSTCLQHLLQTAHLPLLRLLPAP